MFSNMFIYGKKDKLIPFWHSEILFSQAKDPKQIFLTEEADHNNVFEVGGKSYLQKIRDFVENPAK